MRVSFFRFFSIILIAAVLYSCESADTQNGIAGTVLYVATNGNDSFSGNLAAPNLDRTDGPFATLSGARDAVRALRRNGALTGPVTVFIRGGVYFLDEPVVFTPIDSGSETAPVRYAAFLDEKPVFSGGRRITDIRMTAPGRAEARIGDATNRQWIFHQLFIDGKRMQRARIPNEGFLNIDGAVTLNNQDDTTTFKFRNDDIKPEWAERGDVEFAGLSKWVEIRVPIKSVDPSTNTAVLKKAAHSSSWNGEQNQRYWIENAVEGLDQPGEWYLNRESGTLTVLCNPNEDLTQSEIIAPRLEQLIILQGEPENGRFVRGIRFEGLAFEHTIAPYLTAGYPDVQAAYDVSGAFKAIGAKDCEVRNCRFERLGNYAIEFERGCRGNRIVGNTITNVGAGGVKVGEPRVRDDLNEYTSHNVTSDNHIYDIGKIYLAAVGVWIGQSSYNFVQHNHIHDTFYTGISVGWSWGYHETQCHHNYIEYNHVHDIGRWILSDMGGIYTLGLQEGTVIRNNLFHDIYSHSYGGWGIYPDEGSTGILIENNVVYNTKSAGFHQHYGKENIVRNNIFAYGIENQVMRTRNEDHLSFWFENNIVLWKEGNLLGSNWQGEDRYYFDNNVYWKEGGEAFKFSQWTWDEWRAKGMDPHSIIGAPMFANAQECDFRLKPESPALKLGFKPIDLSMVGVRR